MTGEQIARSDEQRDPRSDEQRDPLLEPGGSQGFPLPDLRVSLSSGNSLCGQYCPGAEGTGEVQEGKRGNGVQVVWANG